MQNKYLETYEKESVNRSQMDIKRKTCDIRTWKNTYFSTYPPPTLIHLTHRFTSASKPAAQKSFWLLSQSLPHLVGYHLQISKVLERISRPSCEPLYMKNTSHCKHETFIYEYPLHWVLLPIKIAQKDAALRYTLKHGRHFHYWNQPLNMCMRICYLNCHEAGLCYTQKTY
jgi:hypothetical protein